MEHIGSQNSPLKYVDPDLTVVWDRAGEGVEFFLSQC